MLKNISRVSTFLLLFLSVSTINAAIVSLNSNGLNYLEIEFTVPVQPTQHNALNIGILSASYSGGFGADATLFDGANILANSQTNYLGERYATPGSSFSAIDPIIDYSSISNGTIDGIFTLFITSGFATFDTDDFFIRPFGDGGSIPAFEGSVLNVSVSSVPIPQALWLFSSAIIGLVSLKRKS